MATNGTPGFIEEENQIECSYMYQKEKMKRKSFKISEFEYIFFKYLMS